MARFPLKMALVWLALSIAARSECASVSVSELAPPGFKQADQFQGLIRKMAEALNASVSDQTPLSEEALNRFARSFGQIDDKVKLFSDPDRSEFEKAQGEIFRAKAALILHDLKEMEEAGGAQELHEYACALGPALNWGGDTAQEFFALYFRRKFGHVIPRELGSCQDAALSAAPPPSKENPPLPPPPEVSPERLDQAFDHSIARAGSAPEPPASAGAPAAAPEMPAAPARAARGKEEIPSLPQNAAPAAQPEGEITQAVSAALKALFPDHAGDESRRLGERWSSARQAMLVGFLDYQRKLAKAYPSLGPEAPERAKALRKALEILAQNGAENSGMSASLEILKSQDPQLAAELAALWAVLSESDEAQSQLNGAAANGPARLKMDSFRQEQQRQDAVLGGLLTRARAGELAPQDFERLWAEAAGDEKNGLRADWDLRRRWASIDEAFEKTNAAALRELRSLYAASPEAAGPTSTRGLLIWASAPKQASRPEVQAILREIQEGASSREFTRSMQTLIKEIDESDGGDRYLNGAYFRKLVGASALERRAMIEKLELQSRAADLSRAASGLAKLAEGNSWKSLDDETRRLLEAGLGKGLTAARGKPEKLRAAATEYAERAKDIASFLKDIHEAKADYPAFAKAAEAAGYVVFDSASVTKTSELMSFMSFYRQNSLDQLWRHHQEATRIGERKALEEAGLTEHAARLEGARKKLLDLMNTTFFDWQALEPELAARLLADKRAEQSYTGYNALHLKELLARRDQIDSRDLGLGEPVDAVRRDQVMGHDGVEVRTKIEGGGHFSHFRSFDGKFQRLQTLDEKGQPVAASAVSLEGVDDPSLSRGLVGSLAEGGRITINGKTYTRKGNLLEGALVLGTEEDGAAFSGTFRLDEKTFALVPVSGTLTSDDPAKSTQEYKDGRLAREIVGSGAGKVEYRVEEIEIQAINGKKVSVNARYRLEGGSKVFKPIVLDENGEAPQRKLPPDARLYSYVDSIGRLKETPSLKLVNHRAVTEQFLKENFPGSQWDTYDVARLDPDIIRNVVFEDDGSATVTLVDTGRLTQVRKYKDRHLAEIQYPQAGVTQFLPAQPEGGTQLEEPLFTKPLGGKAYGEMLKAFKAEDKAHSKIGTIVYRIRYHCQNIPKRSSEPTGTAECSPMLADMRISAALYDKQYGLLGSIDPWITDLRLEEGTWVREGAAAFGLLEDKSFAFVSFAHRGDLLEGDYGKIKQELEIPFNAWWKKRRARSGMNDYLNSNLENGLHVMGAVGDIVVAPVETVVGVGVMTIGAGTTYIFGGANASKATLIQGFEIAQNNGISRRLNNLMHGEKGMDQFYRDVNADVGIQVVDGELVAAPGNEVAEIQLRRMRSAAGLSPDEAVLAEQEGQIQRGMGTTALVNYNFTLAQQQDSLWARGALDALGAAGLCGKTFLDMEAFGTAMPPVFKGLSQLSKEAAAMEAGWLKTAAVTGASGLEATAKAAEFAFMRAPFALDFANEAIFNANNEPWDVRIAKAAGQLAGMAASQTARAAPELQARQQALKQMFESKALSELYGDNLAESAEGRRLLRETSVPRFILQASGRELVNLVGAGTLSHALSAAGLSKESASILGTFVYGGMTGHEAPLTSGKAEPAKPRGPPAEIASRRETASTLEPSKLRDVDPAKPAADARFLVQRKYGFDPNDTGFTKPLGQAIDGLKSKIESARKSSEPISARQLRLWMDEIAAVRHDIAKAKGDPNWRMYGLSIPEDPSGLPAFHAAGTGEPVDPSEKDPSYLAIQFQLATMIDIIPEDPNDPNGAHAPFFQAARGRLRKRPTIEIDGKTYGLSYVTQEKGKEGEPAELHLRHPSFQNMVSMRDRAFAILADLINGPDTSEAATLDKMAAAYQLLVNATPYCRGSPAIIESFFDAVLRAKLGKTFPEKTGEPFWHATLWDPKTGPYTGKDFLSNFGGSQEPRKIEPATSLGELAATAKAKITEFFALDQAPATDPARSPNTAPRGPPQTPDEVVVGDRRDNERLMRRLNLGRAANEVAGAPMIPAIEKAAAEASALDWDGTRLEERAGELGLKTEQERRLYLLAVASGFGVGLDGVIRKFQRETLQDADAAGAKADEELLREIKKTQNHLMEAFKAIATKADTMPGAALSAQEAAALFDDLSQQGLSAAAIKKAVNQTLGFPKEQWVKSGKSLGEFLKERMGQQTGAPPPIQLDEVFSGGRPSALAKDEQTVAFVAHQAQRAAAGHTLPIADYVGRHLGPSVQNFVAQHPEAAIRIYGCDLTGALAHLNQDGLSEIRPLTRNKLTDFSAFLARDPKNGKTALVVVGPSGRAFPREIAAHFLYSSDGPAIAPERISVFGGGADAPRAEFVGVLKAQKIDPDILVAGNVEQLQRRLADLGIRPTATIASQYLFGYMYQIGERQVLSVKVEPHLFADRAGEMVRALAEISSKKRAVIFAGTAGALETGMKVQDIVIPASFAQSDAIHSAPVDGAKNLALGLAQQLWGPDAPGVMTGAKVGSVDSIFFEDQQWLKRQREQVAAVEQETAGVAAAAKETGAGLYVFLRVSDIVGQEDFTANEVNRPKSRAPGDQGDLLIAALRREIGELSPSSQGAPAGKTPGAGKADPASIETTAGGASYELRIEGLPEIARFGPDLPQDLTAELRQLVESAGLDQASDSAEALTRLANIARQFHEKRNLTVKVSPKAAPKEKKR